jgi:hypothetical protein
MNNIVLFSPFSQKLRNGNQNPKNFPYWQELITEMKRSGKVDEIWQIGVGNEYRFEGVTQRFFDKPIKELVELANKASVWLSVENFFPHMCNAFSVTTKGIVIFSKSDPIHYGYPQNINLLKDRKYLRPDQFHIWEQCDYQEEAFVSAQKVLQEVLKILDGNLENP